MIAELVVNVAAAIAAAAILTGFGLLAARLTKTRKNAKENLGRILDWYLYIDTKLDSTEYSPAEVEAIEKEIGHQFESTRLRKYVLHFTKAIISKFLGRMGIKEALHRDLSLFSRYARLDHPSVEVALSLQSAAHHREYSQTKLPFSFYWGIIQGNYLHFYSQYKTEWRNVKDGDRKYTIADIEVPIKLLRIIFKR